MQAYHDFTDWEYTSELNPELKVESKVKDVEDFKFTKLTINRPLRLEYKEIHFDEATAENYKEADRALLKEVATYWENNMPNHVGFPDITFFLELKKQNQSTARKGSPIEKLFRQAQPRYDGGIRKTC